MRSPTCLKVNCVRAQLNADFQASTDRKSARMHGVDPCASHIRHQRRMYSFHLEHRAFGIEFAQYISQSTPTSLLAELTTTTKYSCNAYAFTCLRYM